MAISQIQVLNKVLQDKSFSIVEDNLLTEEYFPQAKEEYQYLANYFNTYNSVPSKETFTEKFPNWDYINVTDNPRALIDDIRENNLFIKAVQVINEASKRFSKDSNEGAEYLLSKVAELQPEYSFTGTDMVANGKERYDEWKKKLDSPDPSFIPTGFNELDNSIFGWQKGNDLICIQARPNTGKTSVIVASAEHACSLGFRVGFISPEMSRNQVGYRMDSNRMHYSNRNLMQGEFIKGYEEYIKELSESNQYFFVSDIKDFDGEITTSKIRNFIKSKKLDILYIDGISYIKTNNIDKRETREDIIGRICQELLTMSTEFGVPIVFVAQTNRKGTEKEEGAGIENITGADNIGQVVTRIISLRKCKDTIDALEMAVTKNRYGRAGDRIIYQFNSDTSQFFNIPTMETIKNMPPEIQQGIQEDKVKYANIF